MKIGHPWFALVSATSALAVAVVGMAGNSTASALDPVPNTDLPVINAGVEGGLGSGAGLWAVYNGYVTVSAVSSPVHSGAQAARLGLTASSPDKGAVLETPTAPNPVAGVPYRVSAWVKTTDPTGDGARVALNVREKSAAGAWAPVGISTTRTLVTGDWTRLTATYTSTLAGSTINPSVSLNNATQARALIVDDLAITALPRFAGDPGAGNLYYGASSTGLRTSANKPPQPTTFETNALGGTRLSVHRTFFRMEPPFTSGNIKDAEVTFLTNQVQDDHAKGRLPHVSIKVSNWGQVAANSTELDDLLTRLAGPKPVFLTLHHEPEDDIGTADNGSVTTTDDYPTGTAADWVAMQNQAISRANTLAPNVTIVPILMSGKFDPANPATREAEKQFIVDNAQILGLDGYNHGTTPGTGSWKTLGQRIDHVVSGLGTSPLASKPIVIGEYGTKPLATSDDATWVTNALSEARARNVVAMSYFNSGQGAADSWEFTNDDRQAAFANIVNNSPWVFQLEDIL